MESWPPVVSGYAVRSRELVLAQAAIEGVDPHVFVTSRQSAYGPPEADSPPPLEGRVRVLAPTPSERRARRVRSFHVDGRALTAAVRDHAAGIGADLIHVHWGSGIGSAAARAAADLGLPLVAEVRFDLAGAVMAQTVRVPAAPLEHVLRRRFERHLAGADAVIAAGDSMAALLRTEMPELAQRVTVVPNGVDAELFAPGPPPAGEREWLGAEPGGLLVGSTAKMLRYEGLDRLVRAAAQLEGGWLPIRFALVGDGPERARLERLARRLRAPVAFPGRVPSDRVPGVLRALDIFAVPRRDIAVTRFAGPIKLLEAMACGVACTGTPVGDVATLLGGGRGQPVVPGDVAGLTGAISALAGDGERRAALGAAARAWVIGHHSWPAAGAMSVRVYDEVLGNERPAGGV